MKQPPARMTKDTPMVVLNSNLGGVGPSIDINAPKSVHIDLSADRETLWVNVDEVCRVRISNMGKVDLRLPSRLDPSRPMIRVVTSEDGNDYDANGVNNRSDMLQLIAGFLHGAQKQCLTSGDDELAAMVQKMDEVLVNSGFVVRDEDLQ